MPPRELSTKYINGPYRRYFDLPYCENAHASQTLDLWLPEKEPEKPLPLIIFFHGGAFRFASKRGDQSEPALAALDRGYAVADVEYRKSGEEIFPAMVLDGHAAVRYLRANAAQYGIDPDKFVLWGPSCCGWLVSMLMLTCGNPAFDDPAMGNAGVSSAVQAVVDWCGPCGNFANMDTDFDPALPVIDKHSTPDSFESLFLGSEVARCPALCRMSDPCTYAKADIPPLLIVHGTDDCTVPTQQSVRFYEALENAGAVNAELHVLSGVPHHGPFWNNSEEINAITNEFIDRVIANL